MYNCNYIIIVEMYSMYTVMIMTHPVYSFCSRKQNSMVLSRHTHLLEILEISQVINFEKKKWKIGVLHLSFFTYQSINVSYKVVLCYMYIHIFFKYFIVKRKFSQIRIIMVSNLKCTNE